MQVVSDGVRPARCVLKEDEHLAVNPFTALQIVVLTEKDVENNFGGVRVGANINSAQK